VVTENTVTRGLVCCGDRKYGHKRLGVLL